MVSSESKQFSICKTMSFFLGRRQKSSFHAMLQRHATVQCRRSGHARTQVIMTNHVSAHDIYYCMHMARQAGPYAMVMVGRSSACRIRILQYKITSILDHTQTVFNSNECLCLPALANPRYGIQAVIRVMAYIANAVTQ
jgi:hypothetical protein